MAIVLFMTSTAALDLTSAGNGPCFALEAIHICAADVIEAAVELALQPGIEAAVMSNFKLAAERIRVRAIVADGDRKSTRLNSSHVAISCAVFCLKKRI